MDGNGGKRAGLAVAGFFDVPGPGGVSSMENGALDRKVKMLRKMSLKIFTRGVEEGLYLCLLSCLVSRNGREGSLHYHCVPPASTIVN